MLLIRIVVLFIVHLYRNSHPKFIKNAHEREIGSVEKIRDCYTRKTEILLNQSNKCKYTWIENKSKEIAPFQVKCEQKRRWATIKSRLSLRSICSKLNVNLHGIYVFTSDQFSGYAIINEKNCANQIYRTCFLFCWFLLSSTDRRMDHSGLILSDSTLSIIPFLFAWVHTHSNSHTQTHILIFTVSPNVMMDISQNTRSH